TIEGAGTKLHDWAIRFKKEDNLPISLLNFQANCNENHVSINWTTTSEINNEYFTIERSHNAKNWESIAQIKGAGNSSSSIYYEFKDENVLDGTAYYRLKQTDYDGQFEYFKIISTNCTNSKQKTNIICYPNPFNQEINIEFSNLESDYAIITIHDALGRTVKKLILDKETIAGGFLSLNLSDLQQGVYLLKLSSNRINHQEKIIKSE
ncbi:MAG: T9SS type A sorting domain-containing protein, partial [Bacteroidales bacterium]|nr:T9SS type A sorting domain-containing protein [Bacteroidales bacterium]